MHVMSCVLDMRYDDAFNGADYLGIKLSYQRRK